MSGQNSVDQWLVENYGRDLMGTAIERVRRLPRYERIRGEGHTAEVVDVVELDSVIEVLRRLH